MFSPNSQVCNTRQVKNTGTQSSAPKSTAAISAKYRLVDVRSALNLEIVDNSTIFPKVPTKKIIPSATSMNLEFSMLWNLASAM